MQRCPALRSRLGERQSPVLELEDRQRAAPLLRRPLKTPGDHEVQHQEELAFECEHDSFAQSSQTGDRATFNRGNGRDCGAQEKGTGDAQGEQAAADDAAVEAVEVRGEIGQLGH
jgi:hypothetical protein